MCRIVKSAACSSGLSSTPKSKSEPAHIIAVGRCAERTLVYNLTVDGAHLFYANGVLSSNTDGEDHCGDETRYACAARPWVRAVPKPKPVRFAKSTQLTINEIIAQRRAARLGAE